MFLLRIQKNLFACFSPGISHCDGEKATGRFNMLDAIMAWVQKGHAPDRITAPGMMFPVPQGPCTFILLCPVLEE
ncbi:MAG: tannase/feruloyl esterase family alpha/beta hydrolase [Deltaproteobacteria bacterium]|nr:tannase/feruloyl esterase family alpha/beta hydrolase [Deltaproteobacteria bacterium]